MKLLAEREGILKYSTLLIQAGMIQYRQGNLSVYNREEGLAAITPSSVPYEKREAEDICVVDLEGNLVEGKWKPTSEMPMHLIFYQNREDINAVVHTHASKSTVFGLVGTEPMPMVLTEAAMCIGGDVPIAPYARPGSDQLAEINLKTVGSGAAAIMAHHGLITVGPDLDHAFLTSIAVESTAASILMARSLGNTLQTLDCAEVKILREIFLGSGPQKT